MWRTFNNHGTKPKGEIMNKWDETTTAEPENGTITASQIDCGVIVIPPVTFEEACHRIADELAELVINKQRDYGHDNILAFGEFGVLVRTNDKVARLRNLQGKEGVTEPRIDAWKDIAGYAIIALMLDKGWFTLGLKRE
jgi:hypothetical protein